MKFLRYFPSHINKSLLPKTGVKPDIATIYVCTKGQQLKMGRERF